MSTLLAQRSRAVVAPWATDVGQPVLVACAHGTREPRARRAMGLLVAALAATRPGLGVRAAFIDVQPPGVPEAVASVLRGRQRAVVVPLLLSGGYHVHVDIAQAMAGTSARGSAALGPDERLTALLADRLRQVGANADDAILLAAAGSSDPRANSDVETVRRQLSRHLNAAVDVAYGAKATPAVPDAVAWLRRERARQRVVVAAYLLAPGHFHNQLRGSGADLVSAPLCAAQGPVDPRLVQVVLDRYDAVAGTGPVPQGPGERPAREGAGRSPGRSP